MKDTFDYVVSIIETLLLNPKIKFTVSFLNLPYIVKNLDQKKIFVPVPLLCAFDLYYKVFTTHFMTQYIDMSN